MNNLELSFAQPAGVSTIGQQAWGLIQGSFDVPKSKVEKNRSLVTYEELELLSN